jgi:hypothetical protein
VNDAQGKRLHDRSTRRLRRFKRRATCAIVSFSIFMAVRDEMQNAFARFALIGLAFLCLVPAARVIAKLVPARWGWRRRTILVFGACVVSIAFRGTGENVDGTLARMTFAAFEYAFEVPLLLAVLAFLGFIERRWLKRVQRETPQ